MEKPLPLVLVVLLSATVLSGCFGGDDTEVLNNDQTDEPQEGMGSVEGRVLTTSLDEIERARVQLVQGGDLVEEVETSETGAYKIQDVEPGDYRIQVSAACCRQEARAVEVVAGETANVDLQLAPYTSEDLREPYVEELEWNGFLACGVGSPVVTTAPCGLEDLDPNDDFLHTWNLSAGVKDVVVGMVWDSTGGVAGENLFIAAENRGCGATECSQSYAREEGASPLLFRLSDPGGEWAFSEIEDEPREMQFRVFPSFEPDVYYQQPFTVYYHIFYHEGAPEAHNPVPDL